MNNKLNDLRNCGNRLETILSLNDETSVIADIGCDHGFITRELIERDIAKKVIAVDISKKSLSKAKKLYINKKASQIIEFIEGDGLHALKQNFSGGIIISGIGAFEIIHILTDRFTITQQAKYIILCAHKNTAVLRKFLADNGFKTIKEVLAHENGRFYECLKTKWDGKKRVISDLECELSNNIIKNNDPLLEKYLNYRINKLEMVFKNMKNYKNRTDMQNKIYLKEKMEELLKCL